MGVPRIRRRAARGRSRPGSGKIADRGSVGGSGNSGAARGSLDRTVGGVHPWRVLAGLVLLALATGVPARSQEPPARERTPAGTRPAPEDAGQVRERPPADRPPVPLEDVTVTASPIIQGNEVDPYASTRTIVSEIQLEDLNAQDLGTALRRTPGVNISRYNPVGSFGGGEGGGVFIRGMGSSRPGAEIKTLVDGVPMYMSVWNHPLLDLMSIDPASAIEVYKSPQPQHFGNAFAIVNIVPKRREEEGFLTRARSAVGSFETFVGTGEHGGRVGDFDYLLGGGYRRSDGHRSHSDGRLLDGYGTLGYRLNDEWSLRFFTLWTDNRARDPGPKGATPDQRMGTYETSAWLGTLTLAHETETAEGTVKLYLNTGTGDWLDQPTSTPGVTEDLFNDFLFHGLRAREALHLWQGGEVVAGLDWDFTQGDWDKKFSDGSTDRWSGHDFMLLSPYLAVSHELGSRDSFYLVPSAGIRFYDNSDFSAEWTPHAGVLFGYRETEIHFGYSRGVIYPGLDVVVFSEKVIPSLGDSWKDLDAETLNHFELGIRQQFGTAVEADLTLFYDDGRNRYVIRIPPPPPPVYENIGDYSTRGIEASVQVRPLPDLALFAGATLLDANPSDLPYTPGATVSAGLNWSFLDGFRFSVDSEYVAGMHVNSQARTTGATSTSKVDGYVLLNAKLRYALAVGEHGARTEIFVAGENLTDTDYEYQPGYPMPGINFMVGAGIEF